MTDRTADCACGQLSLTTRGEPPVVALCSCQQCLKRTGSVYSAHAFFLQTDVEVSGEHKAFERTSDSGRHVTFHFCPACGSTLFWKANARPEYFGVAIGAFADADFPPPQSAIWTESRVHWAPFPSGIPTHPKGTPPAPS